MEPVPADRSCPVVEQGWLPPFLQPGVWKPLELTFAPKPSFLPPG